MSCAAHRAKFPPWTGTVAAPLDDHKYSIAKAALRLEYWMTNPPTPRSAEVFLDGRLIAVVSLENLKAVHARLLTLEGEHREEVNANELAEKLLTYFDRYQLGSVAPIVVELEKALDAEYRRGLEEAGCWKDK